MINKSAKQNSAPKNYAIKLIWNRRTFAKKTSSKNFLAEIWVNKKKKTVYSISKNIKNAIIKKLESKELCVSRRYHCCRNAGKRKEFKD